MMEKYEKMQMFAAKMANKSRISLNNALKRKAKEKEIEDIKAKIEFFETVEQLFAKEMKNMKGE